MQKMKRWSWAASLTVLTAWGLAGCGGGNDPLPPKASISQVYVMGDSLADVGTFSIKFTVQDSSNSKGFPIWTQLVANAFGLDGSAQCNAYQGAQTFNNEGDTTSETYSDNANTTCTNYAIGGGRIVVPPSLINAAANNPSNPRNIVRQLEKRAAQGNYMPSDLVMIDGGGNDAADLAGAFIGFATAADADKPSKLSILNTVLGQMGLSSSGADAAAKGEAYMTALADAFSNQITVNTLNKGASRVAILDIPDITLTPRFKMVIASIAAVDPAGGAQIKQLIQTWISAFNARLAQNFSSEKRVVVVPFFTDFTDEVMNPGAYLLSNVNDASCPVTGIGSDGLPSYTFATCTSAALDATPGKSAGWWKSYAFSDGFHPTPYGHQLLAASVSRALARAGWL